MIDGSPEFILNNNSAFGGHNVSMVIRNDLEHGEFRGDHDIPGEVADRKNGVRDAADRPIAIVGLGGVNHHASFAGKMVEQLQCAGGSDRCAFELKKFDVELYERRMNPLTQFGLGADV